MMDLGKLVITTCGVWGLTGAGGSRRKAHDGSQVANFGDLASDRSTDGSKAYRRKSMLFGGGEGDV